MIEIRLHGRGGQGVKLAAMIIGRAAYLSGYQTQDFAIYGAERQGAPLASSVRMDKEPIKDRGYLFNPDIIIILDDTIDRKVTTKGAKKDTKIYINSMKKSPAKNTYYFDATGVALDKIGIPKVNVAFLGAFIKKFRLIPFENFIKAIKIELESHPETIEKNIVAAKECYEKMNGIITAGSSEAKNLHITRHTGSKAGKW